MFGTTAAWMVIVLCFFGGREFVYSQASGGGGEPPTFAYSFQNGGVIGMPELGMICAHFPDSAMAREPDAQSEFLTVVADSRYANAPIEVTPPQADRTSPIVEFVPQSGTLQTPSFKGKLDHNATIVIELRSTDTLGSTLLTIKVGPGAMGAPEISVKDVAVYTFVLAPTSRFTAARPMVNPENPRVRIDEHFVGLGRTMYSPRSPLIHVSSQTNELESAAIEDAGGDWLGGVEQDFGFEQLYLLSIDFLNANAEEIFVGRGAPLDTTFGAEQEITALTVEGSILVVPLVPPPRQLFALHNAISIRHSHDFVGGYPEGRAVFQEDSPATAPAAGGRLALNPETNNHVFGYDLVRSPASRTDAANRVDRAVLRHDVQIGLTSEPTPGFNSRYRVELWDGLLAFTARFTCRVRGSVLYVYVRPRAPWETPEEFGF